MALAPGAAKESDLTWLDDSLVADLSRDGQKLVLLNEGGIAEGANEAVYLRKTDGSPAVRLGEGVARGVHRREMGDHEAGQRASFFMPTGAGEPKALATPGLEVKLAGWFPDGKKIYYNASFAGKADTPLRAGRGRRRAPAHRARRAFSAGPSRPTASSSPPETRIEARVLSSPGRGRRAPPPAGRPRRGNDPPLRRDRDRTLPGVRGTLR